MRACQATPFSIYARVHYRPRAVLATHTRITGGAPGQGLKLEAREYPVSRNIEPNQQGQTGLAFSPLFVYICALLRVGRILTFDWILLLCDGYTSKGSLLCLLLLPILLGAGR